jgi:hypothetical protein
MEYRNATIKDISGISELQQKYHVSTISEEDRNDGFVTTLFTEEQFKDLSPLVVISACHHMKEYICRLIGLMI